VQEIKITMSAYFGFVPGIRTGLGRVAVNFGFNDKEVYEIETVLDEICNNAIEHGSKGKDNTVSLEIKFDKRYIEINVKDSGSPQFNVEEVLKEGQRLMEEEAQKPILDTIRRKRGLMIVKKYVDTMDIKSNADGTVVSMLKRSRTSEKERGS
jgi:anti-sigma regulatory factor (Ser/Thr protein kinase)